MDEIRDRIPAYAKDLSLNLANVLAPDPAAGASGALTDAQRWGVALACAAATEHAALRESIARETARIAGDAVVEDARAAAALMAMNNVYYRFRHVIGKESYLQRPARLRMTRIAKPSSDKATFELMCLAVSAIHGCEACMRSHEASVVAAGLGEDAVHDAVRIAATIRGVAAALA